MLQRARALWQEYRAGFTGSLLLHVLFGLIALWWGITHPVSRQPPLKPMLVDLVAVPPAAPAPSGGRAAALLPQKSDLAAPKIEGVKPKSATPPPDELEA